MPSNDLPSPQPGSVHSGSEGHAAKPPLAILLDLDGTLVDSYRAIQLSVNHVRANLGLAELSEDEVRSFVGNGLERLLELTAPTGDPAENARLFVEHHRGVLASGTSLLPGVHDTLVSLRSLGCKLAICSNKPIALTSQLLDALGVRELFDGVLGPESVARRKPAPDMLLEAVRLLGVPADRAVYVGDMTIDIETARAAGLPVWVVPTGSHPVEVLKAAQPDHLAQQFSELLSLFSASHKE